MFYKIEYRYWNVFLWLYGYNNPSKYTQSFYHNIFKFNKVINNLGFNNCIRDLFQKFITKTTTRSTNILLYLNGLNSIEY